MFFGLVTQGILILLCISIVWRIFRFYQRRGDNLHNIPGPKSGSWLTGHYFQLFGFEGFDFHRHIAEKYGRVASLDGPLGARQLFLFDYKAFQHVFTKDQLDYEESPFLSAVSRVMFGDGITAATGHQRIIQRKLLGPAFSANHVRTMFPALLGVARRLSLAFEKSVSSGPQEIDVYDWMARTSGEMIAQGSLRHSVDDLTADAPATGYILAGDATNVALRQKLLGVLFLIFMDHIPQFALKLQINIGKFTARLMSFLGLSRFRTPSPSEMIYGASTEIFNAATAEQGKLLTEMDKSTDLIDILLRAHAGAGQVKGGMSEEQAVSQISTFMFAGLDTVASAFARLLHTLAAHPHIQEQLREEVINSVGENGCEQLTYDQLGSLPLLDAVLKETLRLYPPVPTLMRDAVRDTVLPLAFPITGIDGHTRDHINLREGDRLYLSLLGCNRDPAMWGPDADEWKPERWLAPLPSSLLDAKIPGLYSHLMTFSGGRTSCLGVKFAEIEIKIILIALILRFRFALPDEEPKWEHILITFPKLKDGNRGLTLKVSHLSQE